jgi:GTP-binding protein
MIDEYLQNPLIKLGVLLLDIRRVPNEDDLLMYNYFKSMGLEVLLVLTKADKLSNNQKINQRNLIKSRFQDNTKTRIITYSTKTKENHEEIWNIINEVVEK